MVTFEAVGEGVQVGQVVGADGGDPGVEAVAVQAGDHLGERLDVAAQGVQVGAGRQYLRELELLAGVEVAGAAADPAGDVTDLGRGGDGGRRGLPLQGCQVGADGAVATAEAQACDLAVQLLDVGASLVPPLVQVGLVVVQFARPSGQRARDQLIDGVGVEVAAGRPGSQPEFPLIAAMLMPSAFSFWTCSYRCRARTTRARFPACSAVACPAVR